MRVVSLGCFMILMFTACSGGGGGGSSDQSDSLQDTGPGGDVVEPDKTSSDSAGGCGDGVCGTGEDPNNCPTDCATYCGNGTCDYGEFCWEGDCDSEGCQECGQDCCPVCGDGICEWPEDTEISYCEIDCAQNCSCDGKCGTVSGPDCEADCGGCGGGLVCGSDNVCVDECAGGTATCGGACCDTLEVCYLNQCCAVAANCAGKMCGSDGCGGICESQASIPGCGPDETCSEEGECVASPQVCLLGDVRCYTSGGQQKIQECQQAEGSLGWYVIESCLGEKPNCLLTEQGATCVACFHDDHCAGGQICSADGECIEVE